MELHSLKPAKGAVKNRKRIARGQGSGRGGTSTRGHNGAKSRSGYSRKRNFEGGQMPLQMRLPKRGFKNPNRVAYVPFNLSTLQMIADKYKIDNITPDVLRDLKFIRRNDVIKVLATGELKSKLSVTAHKCSAKAKEAVEAAGGSITLL